MPKQGACAIGERGPPLDYFHVLEHFNILIISYDESPPPSPLLEQIPKFNYSLFLIASLSGLTL